MRSRAKYSFLAHLGVVFWICCLDVLGDCYPPVVECEGLRLSGRVLDPDDPGLSRGPRAFYDIEPVCPFVLLRTLELSSG